MLKIFLIHKVPTNNNCIYVIMEIKILLFRKLITLGSNILNVPGRLLIREIARLRIVLQRLGLLLIGGVGIMIFRILYCRLNNHWLVIRLLIIIVEVVMSQELQITQKYTVLSTKPAFLLTIRFNHPNNVRNKPQHVKNTKSLTIVSLNNNKTSNNKSLIMVQ